MADFIESLRDTKNRLLKAEVEDLNKWKKLKHNKVDFELFLNHNIAEIQFLTEKKELRKIICTSNTTLIKLFSTKKKAEKQKIAKFRSTGIHTRNMNSVLTWDLEDNKYKTILLTQWKILNFVSITPENIIVLDEVIRDLLKK